MKNKRFILLVIVIVILFIISFILLNKNNINDNVSRNNVSQIEYANPCLNKGNICNLNDIIDGILVKVFVTNDKEIEFYVISNDADNMTLISKDVLIDNLAWNILSDNTMGPLEIFDSISYFTKDWTNIDNLNYDYNDTGHISFNNSCIDNNEEYDCNSIYNMRGYQSINIKNGKFSIKTYETINIEINDLKARIPNRNEIESLMIYNRKIDWLKSDQPFWTLDSVTGSVNGYNRCALAVASDLSRDSGFVLNIYPVEQKLSAKLVITIQKKSCLIAAFLLVIIFYLLKSWQVHEDLFYHQ